MDQSAKYKLMSVIKFPLMSLRMLKVSKKNNSI